MEDIRENYEIDTQNITEHEGRRRLYQIPSVDNALTNIMSLPKVVNDVSQIHKGQTLAIRKQQKHLDALQEQLKLVEQEEKKNLESLSSITRQLHISEEDTQKKKQTCDQYEQEISDLVKECEFKTSVIFHLKKSIKEEKWEHDKSREKVIKYKDVVEDMKTASEDELSLKEKRNQVEALRLKWQAIQQSGDGETILNETSIERHQSEYEALKIQEKTNEENIQAAKEKVENLKSEIKQTDQSTYVLHKRNKAQLTRLKREMKELTNQSGHWKERLALLQQQISTLHRQICKSS